MFLSGCDWLPDLVSSMSCDLCPQVSQWYELVVFTASMEIYGSAVADKLDNNRGVLRRRYYRQVPSTQEGLHCPPATHNEQAGQKQVSRLKTQQTPAFFVNTPCTQCAEILFPRPPI